MGISAHQLPWIAGFIVCAVAAWSDVTTRRVPNRLTLPLMAVAPFFSLVNGWKAFAIAWLVLAIVFVAGAQLHAHKLFGGGDIKLFIGVATLCSFPRCIELALYTALFGGIMAASIAVVKREPEVFANVFSRFSYSLATGRLQTEIASGSSARMPYAVAIFLGFSAAVLADGVAPFLRILR